jgi:hypothetical protein
VLLTLRSAGQDCVDLREQIADLCG